jgi:hypothetical protein
MAEAQLSSKRLKLRKTGGAGPVKPRSLVGSYLRGTRNFQANVDGFVTEPALRA